MHPFPATYSCFSYLQLYTAISVMSSHLQPILAIQAIYTQFQSCTARSSHFQPFTVICSHLQPFKPFKPLTAISINFSHLQPFTVLYKYLQPCTAIYSNSNHLQQLTAFYSQLQPVTDITFLNVFIVLTTSQLYW